MKTFAAIAAAAMFFAMAAQSAEPSFNFEAAAEAADSVAISNNDDNRCQAYPKSRDC